MKAGSLRHLVEVQSATRTTDAGGGVTEVWATITGGQRWARISPVSASEAFASAQLQERVTHMVVMRYLSTVTTAMRIKLASRYLYVQSVLDPEERHVQTVCRCEERMAA